jgi:ParB-like chromosome segregation protein Spo0J
MSTRTGLSPDPIELKADGSVCDGLHRWRAAKHLGLEEVEVKTAREA